MSHVQIGALQSRSWCAAGSNKGARRRQERVCKPRRKRVQNAAEQGEQRALTQTGWSAFRRPRPGCWAGRGSPRPASRAALRQVQRGRGVWGGGGGTGATLWKQNWRRGRAAAPASKARTGAAAPKQAFSSGMPAGSSPGKGRSRSSSTQPAPMAATLRGEPGGGWWAQGTQEGTQETAAFPCSRARRQVQRAGVMSQNCMQPSSDAPPPKQLTWRWPAPRPRPPRPPTPSPPARRRRPSCGAGVVNSIQGVKGWVGGEGEARKSI